MMRMKDKIVYGFYESPESEIERHIMSGESERMTYRWINQCSYRDVSWTVPVVLVHLQKISCTGSKTHNFFYMATLFSRLPVVNLR